MCANGPQCSKTRYNSRYSRERSFTAHEHAKNRRAPRAMRAMVYLTPDELLAVLKAAKARSARDWAMVLLAYRHGLRASEVCDLKLADIDLKAASISIRRLKGSLHTVQPPYQHRGQPRSMKWAPCVPGVGSGELTVSITCSRRRRVLSYLPGLRRGCRAAA